MSFDSFKLDIAGLIQKHSGKPITFITKSGVISGIVETQEKQDNFNSLAKLHKKESPLVISLVGVQIINGISELYFEHAVIFTDDIISIAYDRLNPKQSEV